MCARERGQVGRTAAAEPASHECAFASDRLPLAHDGRPSFDEPLVEGCQRRLRVPGHARELADRVRRDRLAPERTANVARKVDLPRPQVAIEGLAERGRVTEGPVARPQPDARGLPFVRIRRLLVEEGPAPRPDVCEPELTGHLLRSERLQLRDLEPGARRLETLATAGPTPRLEAQHEPDPRRRHADREQLRSRTAHRGSHPPASEHRPRLVDGGRVEVLLERDVRDAGQVAPPLRGLAARVRLARDEEDGPAAPRGEQARPLQHVRAISRGRRRPRCRRRRPEELVHRDDRRRARGGEHGEVEDLRGTRRKHVGIGGSRRRADPRVQVHVPVDGLRAGGARGCRIRLAGAGDDDTGTPEHRQQLSRAVVDPERLRVGQPARVRPSGIGRRRESRGREQDDHEVPHRPRL